jgi:hypothetical protein
MFAGFGNGVIVSHCLHVGLCRLHELAWLRQQQRCQSAPDSLQCPANGSALRVNLANGPAAAESAQADRTACRPQALQLVRLRPPRMICVWTLITHKPVKYNVPPKKPRTCARAPGSSAADSASADPCAGTQQCSCCRGSELGLDGCVDCCVLAFVMGVLSVVCRLSLNPAAK